MQRSRFLLAVAVAAALILAAPFIGEVRRALRATFAAQYLTILSSVLAVTIAAAVLAAVVRIRERRVLRYSAVAAALLLGTIYSIWTATADPQVNAVERFHFVQYGLVTLLFYRACRPFDDGSVLVLPVLAALLVATVEEWFQWFVPARVGEMADVFLNAAAIGTGLLFSIGVDPPRRVSLSLRAASLQRAGPTAAVVTVVFGAFLHSVHLGYSISDPAAGAFTSRYDAGTLDALSRDRYARWRENPPLLPPPRLSREDQYMSEGLLHVRERNRRWESGEIAAAWHENLILETFYAPVLDTRSYVSDTGHRWPAGQRADAEARLSNLQVGSTTAAYVSLADEGFIRTWPKPLFWAIVLTIAAAILLATRAGARQNARPETAIAGAARR